MIIPDSSFLVAFFDETDSQHQKAVEEMKRYDELREEFLITEHILGEIATVLSYHNGLEAAVKFLSFSREKCTLHNWTEEDFNASIEVFSNQTRDLSYIDATIIHLARVLHLPVACYDEDLLKEIDKK